KNNMSLTEEQVEAFGRDGCLVVEGFLSSDECDEIKQRAYKIITEADLSKHPMVTFETRANKQATSNYFITSGDKIRFFFEEGAVDEQGKLTVPIDRALNKMGHALHALDPVFKNYTFGDKVKGVAQSLKLKRPTIVQSMVIFKQPNIGGDVRPHQDSTYLDTTPRSLIGFWIALEDADVENGCLWFIPGSQGTEVRQRMVRTTIDGALATKFEGTQLDVKEEDFVAAPVKKGALVLIHGQVIHKSEMNKSPRSRNIYTFHLYDAGVSEWSKDNWLQPSEELPFPYLY
ncbi:hypothetical protein EMCRGX_G023789, partial [Ephydatia muelleri]